MSRLYGPQHRALQSDFESEALADRIEMIGAKQEIDDLARGFIESRDMFFLTTIDHQGRPTVSYKGGAPGFVRVLDEKTIVFPSYDGNGMYLSMGNITANPEIGCLFIDFERPHRLRLQGRAELVRDAELIKTFPGAELAVKVTVGDIWQNCPRYIHRYEKKSASRYTPEVDKEAPVCGWKRIDAIQDVLRPAEQDAAKMAGHITPETWMEQVLTGDENA